MARDAGDTMENMDNFDRLSNLPEPIRHHILSFLSFKQVIQTSVLSKTWERAWHRFPFLVFDSTFFNQVPRYWATKREARTVKMKLWKVFNYMEETLHNRQKEMVSIKMFALDLDRIAPSLEEFEPFLDQCIFHALESDVKMLTLRFQYWGRQGCWQYKFPRVFLCSKSINVLVLAGCELESPRSVWLPSLRELHLLGVNVDDQVIKNLVAGCPLIEVLSLQTCGGLKSLELFGHGKISVIRVLDNNELNCVVIKGESVHSIIIEVPSIPCKINVASCKNLKSLKLSRVSLTDEWFRNQISNSPLLERLSINTCAKLTSVKISSLHLKQLYLIDCESLVEVKIRTPNLRIFKYGGDIVSFTSDALTLSETDLCFSSDDIDTQWFVKYVELLARFHGFSKVLRLGSSLGENLIVPEEVRQIQPSPLCNVEHLNIVITTGGMSVAVTDAIDGLLWISPHTKAVSIEPQCPSYETFFFKFRFSYKKPPVYEGGIAQCCKYRIISCWQQCIEEVEIVYCTGKASDDDDESRDGNDIKRYIVKGEDIWEKIVSLRDLSTPLDD